MAKELARELQIQNISFAAITFVDLIDAVRRSINDQEFEMQALVNDFENFIQEEGLLPTTYHTMHAVPVGWSFDANFKYGVYFDPPSRGHRARTYLGLYTQKQIKAIGLVDKVVVVTLDQHTGQLEVTDHLRGEITNDEDLARIKGCIQTIGWASLDGLRFTVVKDQFIPTSFQKVSKGGLLGARYFNLYEEIGQEEWDPTWDNPDTTDLTLIAQKLSEKQWH